MRSALRSALLSLLLASAALAAGDTGIGESATVHRSGGSSTSSSTGALIYSVKTYGAKCDGATDDTAAVQATIDALPSGGGGVYFPSATCNVVNPVFIKKDHVRIFGDGSGSIVNGAGNYRPMFIFYPATGWQDIPTKPAMISNVLSLDFPDNTGWLELSEYMRTVEANGGFTLNGKSALGIATWFWPYSAGRGGPNYIVGSSGKSSGGAALNQAFFIREDGSGNVTCGLKTSSASYTATGGAVLTMDAANHVEFSWTGNSLKCAVNGTFGTATATAGTLQQQVWEQTVIGPQFDEYSFMKIDGGGPKGRVGNFVMYQAPLHTANFTSTGYQNPINSDAIIAPRSDQISHLVIGVSNGLGSGSGSLTYRRDGSINQTQIDDEIDHLEILNTGRAIQMFSIINARVHDIYFNQINSNAVILDNNSYGSSLQSLKGTNANPQTYVTVTSSGIVVLHDFYFVGAKVAAVYSGGAGITSVEDGYIVSSGSTLYHIWINAWGQSEPNFHAHSLNLSTESGSETASMTLESLASATIDGSVFENIQAGAAGLIRLDNTDNASAGTQYQGGFPVVLTGNTFKSVNTTDTTNVIDIVGTWTKPSILMNVNKFDNTTVPLAANLALVNKLTENGVGLTNGKVTIDNTGGGTGTPNAAITVNGDANYVGLNIKGTNANIFWGDQTSTNINCNGNFCTWNSSGLTINSGVGLSSGNNYTATSGDFSTTATGRFIDTTASAKLIGTPTDGSTAVGVQLQSGTNLVTAGAKIVTISNNSGASVVASVDKDGYIASVTPFYKTLTVGTAALSGTLNGFVLPARAATVTAVTYRIGTAGTGGTTGLVLKLSDGTNTCTFTSTCTATGNVRTAGVNGAGTGCVFPASASITLTVDATTDCAGNPAILNGGLDAEYKWQ